MGEMQVQLQALFNPALDGEMSGQLYVPAALPSGKETPVATEGRRNQSWENGKRKSFPCLSWESNPIRPTRSLTTIVIHLSRLHIQTYSMNHQYQF